MPLCVLIAEDEHSLRELMRMELEDAGVRVSLARDGEEAIAAIAVELPSLVLLDLMMPRKDGFAVLHYIADHHPTLPVIVLSNLSDPRQMEQCLELGARDYLVKSHLDSGELWDKVRMHTTTVIS